MSPLAWCVLVLGGVLAEPTDSPLRYEAPDDCQWWIRGDEVALTCNLRTINSEFDTTNFSVIPAEHTTALRVECSPDIMSRSGLDDRSFAHLTRLRELELEHCKLGEWPAGTLLGLRDLRNLTVRTHNTDWPAVNLDFAKDSFAPVRQLERLDLSCNNIWSFPENLFCPLINLVALNVSENRLQDVGDLGFREKAPGPPQPLISVADEDQAHREAARTFAHPCSLDIQVLDASFNHFVLIPPNGFSALRRLRVLYLHDNEISMVADRAIAGLKALQVLDLSHNRLVALPAELFRDCAGSIKEIYLQNNSISVLAPGLFSNLEQLMALDLSRNALTSSWINADTFSGLIRLVLLNLSYNRITKLEPAFFRDLYTLQILNLERNSLETIPADTFAPMNNLHTLIISYNKITYLDAYSLNGLYVLSLLALDNNLLEGIHPEAFRNCSSLQDLNLNGNALKAVPLALKDMRLLRTVDLGENLISSLEEPGFRGMSNLYGLRLIGNRLENISKRAFHDLPALQILNLARNKIQRIEKGAFESSANLQAIRLDANLLTDVEGLFADISTLLWLNISDNQIARFDYSLIPSGLQWLDMHKNLVRELANRDNLELRLQTLDASFNKLTRIHANAVPSSIELLFLNDNLITTVEPHTFLKKTNLTRVDLYANQIVSMDLNALRLTPVDPERPLPEFYIGGNPFQCDCTMEWLQRINKLDHLRQHPRVMDLESIYCKLLYNRDTNYLPLIEAESSQFLCTYKTHCFALCHCCDFDACDCEMTCPTNCTCYHDQSWSANLVECSGVGYTEMPSRIPMDATEVYLDGNNFGELSSHSFIGRKNLKVLFANNSNIAAIYNHTFSGLRRLSILHLENNKIKELLGFELASLENLRELYLQGNLIHYIDNRTFLELKQLEVLRLDGNRLSFFEVWQFASNPYLVEIGLAENQWSCDCHYVQKFKSWFKANQEKVFDGSRIACMFNNPRHRRDAGDERLPASAAGDDVRLPRQRGDRVRRLLLPARAPGVDLLPVRAAHVLQDHRVRGAAGQGPAVRRLRQLQRQGRGVGGPGAGPGPRGAGLPPLPALPRLQRVRLRRRHHPRGGGVVAAHHRRPFQELPAERVVPVRVQVGAARGAEGPAPPAHLRRLRRAAAPRPGPGPAALPQDQHGGGVGRPAVLAEAAVRDARRAKGLRAPEGQFVRGAVEVEESGAAAAAAPGQDAAVPSIQSAQGYKDHAASSVGVADVQPQRSTSPAHGLDELKKDRWTVLPCLQR